MKTQYDQISRITYPPTDKSTDVKPKQKRVIKGAVKTKKPSSFKKFITIFAGEEIENVGDYLLNDILIPGIKKIFYDSVTGGLEMSLFNGERMSRNSLRRDGSKVSYGSFFESNAKAATSSRVSVSKKAFDDIFFDNKWEAEEVYGNMFDIVKEYDFVSVQDLRLMVGLPYNYTDDNYGWDEDTITHGDVKRCKDGWYIALSSPKPRL